MNQTLAIFIDAYRELNAKKLFWITLGLTAAIVGAFALVGVNDKGISIAGATLPMPAPMFVYKWAFSYFWVGIWAKWAALILALISTASIFPDLIAGGSIDLYLSKPIGRWRLFLTKYATGLLFTTLQVSVFTVGSYVVFGLRAHDWRPALFLTIPLVLLLYSYLFCFCTLIGVMTRSTIAAILLTVLFWFICFGINFAEVGLFSAKSVFVAEARAYASQVRKSDAELRDLKTHSTNDLSAMREQRIAERRDREQELADDTKHTADKITLFHRIAYGVATVIPKTGETVDLLDRKLFSDADLDVARQQGGDSSMSSFGARRPAEPSVPTAPTTNPAEALAQAQEDDREERQEVNQETADEVTRTSRSRSVPWIIGTSLAFELVMVGWGGWIFCRRDY